MRATPSGGGCWRSERIESDAVAESFESSDEPVGDLLAVVFVKVVGAEVGVRTVVLE
jgi:hypothetical protein